MVIDKKTYIKSVRIELGLELGAGKPDEAWIELREPSTLEWLELQEVSSKGEAEVVRKIIAIFPSLVVGHNLFTQEGDKQIKLDAKAVIELVVAKIGAALKLINSYVEAFANPLARTSGAK